MELVSFTSYCPLFTHSPMKTTFATETFTTETFTDTFSTDECVNFPMVKFCLLLVNTYLIFRLVWAVRRHRRHKFSKKSW